MGSFIDEYWQTLWTGWTPVITVGFFFVGLKLSSFMAGYFNTGFVWFITRFFVPFIIAGVVPFFAMTSKNRR